MQQEIEYTKVTLHEEWEVCLYTWDISYGITVIQFLHYTYTHGYDTHVNLFILWLHNNNHNRTFMMCHNNFCIF